MQMIMQTEMKESLNRPKYIAFSTQKGGAGKTTITVLVASYLHYVKNCNVAIIDCDYPQYSAYDLRKRDKEKMMQDEYYQSMAAEMFERIGKGIYPVASSKAADAIGLAERMTEKEGNLDYIFFDLPGTINNTAVISLLAEMDYVFCPIVADNVVMKSSIIFTERFLKKMPGIKGCYLMWNMVDRREKSEVYDMWAKILEDLDVPVLKTQMPNMLRFRKEQGETRKGVFRSTLFPPDKALLKGSNVEELTEEVLSIISSTEDEA